MKNIGFNGIFLENGETIYKFSYEKNGQELEYCLTEQQLIEYFEQEHAVLRYSYKNLTTFVNSDFWGVLYPEAVEYYYAIEMRDELSKMNRYRIENQQLRINK